MPLGIDNMTLIDASMGNTDALNFIAGDGGDEKFEAREPANGQTLLHLLLRNDVSTLSDKED